MRGRIFNVLFLRVILATMSVKHRMKAVTRRLAFPSATPIGMARPPTTLAEERAHDDDPIS